MATMDQDVHRMNDRPVITTSLYAILFGYMLLIRTDMCAASSENQGWLDHARRINLQNINGLNPPTKVDQGYSTREEKPKEIIEQASHDLSTRLRLLSNSEIGITNMQAIFDSLPYEEKKREEEQRLEEMVKRLKTRFHKYLRVLGANKVMVENFFKFHVKEPITLAYSCCDMACSKFKSHNLYGCRISKGTSCDLLPPSLPRGAFNPGRNVTEVWESNTEYFPSVKWQYFISLEGVHNEYPANSFSHACHAAPGSSGVKDCTNIHDTRHRDVFMRTIQPQAKHVVIVMDHGISLSPTQMIIAKAVTKHLIASFSDDDKIAVMGMSNQPKYAQADSCLNHSMIAATYETRQFFTKFVDGLQKADVTTNHTRGFEKAFEFLEELLQTSPDIDKVMILYVSRGLLSSLTEAKQVMEVLSLHNARLEHRVIINTYPVIDDSKPIMYEKSFLHTVANQNYEKYDVAPKLKKPVIRGMMMAINSTRDLSSTVGKFYLPLNRTAAKDPVISLPYIDEADGALTMSLSQACVHTLPDQPELRQLIGLVGVDLHMEDVVQDITYYSHADSSYAFIISTQGFTIMHPSFQRPMRTSIQPMPTDISKFEQHEGFSEVREAILSSTEGEMTIVLHTTNQTALDGEAETVEHTAQYFWKKVESSPFIVVIKSYFETNKQRKLRNILMNNQPDLLYHRLDLLPNEHMCYHLKQLSAPETSAVFLSANSFINPFEHLSEEETRHTVQSYIAFLKDDTRLIKNPGLKGEVRNDVAATGRISEEWLRRFKTSDLNDYIIRRYVGTPSGVLRTFPGTLLDKMYDPTKRQWYTRAMEYPGHVTLSAPYLDIGGAGYIVTISHTIYEGKPAAMHGPQDKVVAVMGMDITLGYFHKLLAMSIHTCEHPSVRCFLMDDKGYLIAHPGLIDPTGKGPAEQRHITHMEPLVANDILNHGSFVQKRLCNRYNDRTVQRHFSFNTSFIGHLTNLVHGEHCAKYHIMHISGTNTFLGMVNHTCDTATAFCPCSMYDRLCLNCKRMEQTECECPCECPLEMNFCSGQLIGIDDRNPSCPHDPEQEKLAVSEKAPALDLKQCASISCNHRKTRLDCMGVVDCQWCQVQQDGNTPLDKPYCASQRVCFGGVVGSHSPYGDEISAEPLVQETVGMKSTPVGPVAGGIMGCFLVLALGVYCYRHHVHRHNHHHYIGTLPDNPNNRISTYYNDDDQEAVEDFGAAGQCHTNFVLATFDNPASVSPYRVNTWYRRPVGGCGADSSDHGYSTMTPREDSEHASMPCLDPFSIGGGGLGGGINKERDKFRPQPTPSGGATTNIIVNPVPPPSSRPGSVSGALPPPPQTALRRSRSPTPPQTRLSLSTYCPIPEQTVLGSALETTILSPTSISSSSPSNGTQPQRHSVPGMTVLPSEEQYLPGSIKASAQVHLIDSH
ncbi:hypothetical protein RRG08_018006 [Elysia crispata]|uniref:VWFA and cache domain-containing protein 1-like n=1 Tax=Elysia crispata TaxID=231223 RepID=A0AAE0ZCY7_9GAST|nr:hypothetical protein RRG08_018006 [Elysia crispata]